MSVVEVGFILPAEHLLTPTLFLFAMLRETSLFAAKILFSRQFLSAHALYLSLVCTTSQWLVE
jgi:hypothetical protein